MLDVVQQVILFLCVFVVVKGNKFRICLVWILCWCDFEIITTLHLQFRDDVDAAVESFLLANTTNNIYNCNNSNNNDEEEEEEDEPMEWE